MSFFKKLFSRKETKIDDNNADAIIDAYCLAMEKLSQLTITTVYDLPYSKDVIERALEWKILDYETSIDLYEASPFKGQAFDSIFEEKKEKLKMYREVKRYLIAFYDVTEEERRIVDFVNSGPSRMECKRILFDSDCEDDEKKSTCRYIIEQEINLMRKYNPELFMQTYGKAFVKKQ